MEGLINLLHTGGYSCTIANKGEIRTFTQRGVTDIYDLLTQEPETENGESISGSRVGFQSLSADFRASYTDSGWFWRRN